MHTSFWNAPLHTARSQKACALCAAAEGYNSHHYYIIPYDFTNSNTPSRSNRGMSQFKP